MSERSASKIEEIINETQELIDTLETLNNEIESYQIAKNNLDEVKDQLQQFITGSIETYNIIKENFLQVNQLLNSELIVRLEEIKSMSEQLNSELIVKSEDFKSEAEQSKVHFDHKFKLLFGVAIINTIGMIVLIIATFIK